MAYTTINDPSQYFDTLLWTGNGNSPRTETGLNFQPDWIWHKNRTDSGRSHYLHDSSRGFGAQKELTTNNNHQEDSDSHLTETAGYINAATSTGFTIGAGSSSQNYTNRAGANYVAWCWKANAATTTSNGASGDIKASVTQREDTAKFAMCTYTGTGINAGQSHRVNHGLGVVPAVMMFKSRGADGDWVVYHHRNTANPETDYLVLNSTAATADSANKFNDTAPTTAYATIGGDDNISSGTMMLYSFAEVQGYSKFGQYTGNGTESGSATGPFVYTGFQPAWIMIHASSESGQAWFIVDNKRDPDNTVHRRIGANTNSTEGTATGDNNIDFFSNGFKIVTQDDGMNKNDVTYLYMAFAESPFVTSNGTPNNAR